MSERFVGACVSLQYEATDDSDTNRISGERMIRVTAASKDVGSDNEKAEPLMKSDDTLARALADVRQQRSAMEAEHERIGLELAKLRAAEKSLAAIVEGGPLEGVEGDPQKRRRAFNAEELPRTNRGSRGPRANSAKGRLKALIEEAGTDGLTHAEIAERLSDVAANTLNTYLSVMSNSGELERHGDSYRSGALSSGSGNAAANDDTTKDNYEEQNEDQAAR